MYPSILLFGPPGSGKGTLGKVLAEASDKVHLSSGDVFRGLGPDHPISEYLKKGELVPDELTIETVHFYIEKLISEGRYNPKKQFLLMDGIPRTLKQAEILDRYHDVKALVLLDVPDENVLIQRIQKRAEIEGRSDDAKQDVLQNRMRVYKEQTAEVLKHYPEETVSHINADQSKSVVLRDVLAAITPVLTLNS